MTNEIQTLRETIKAIAAHDVALAEKLQEVLTEHLARSDYETEEEWQLRNRREAAENLRMHRLREGGGW